ncbi:DUF192 domain-containing protein [Oleomonas cavernae]|uniref:DUF192 domain-containing protein n=1 Tax=Oleomonas cavernae TaxID=2320859 RepID=A0A418W9Q6_9PROT|nr:DUF192 domain-containing protein [Oleomonas cavernae]RJF86719.1 DUF192 domain-containing protein [Oleomonas cavernae]
MSTLLRRLCAPALLVLALVRAGAAHAEQLTIVSAAGTRHAFQVEIADEDAERMKGLMFREQLASDAGMLFLYPRPVGIVMWMKNTPLPLDMLFVDQKGIITSIAADTVPYSTDRIPADRLVIGVLEVNAGTAARLHIVPGDRIDYPAFR